MKNLESVVFDTDFDKKVLDLFLGTLDNTKIVYISREKYNLQWWDIFKKNNEFYDIYLPEDLKVWELASIIRKINNFTFKNNKLPIFSSSKELQVKIIYTYDFLLERLWNETNEKDKEKIQKTLKKYYLLYADLFPLEENNLNNNNYKKWILDELNKQENIITLQKTKEYTKKLNISKTKIRLKELLDDLEQNISQELIKHLSESFFEKWVNDLRYWLDIVTQTEQDELIKYCEENWFQLYTDSEEHLNYKKWDEIFSFKLNKEKEAQNLRDKLWIDNLKQELEIVRGKWSKEEISWKELEIANEITEWIYNNFNYILNENNYWYQIDKILKNKQIYCVWFSLIWHSLFSELGIQHERLYMSQHSSLKVMIWWKEYICDVTWSKILCEIEKYWEYIGIYRPVILKEYWYYNSVVSWNPEEILITSIYYNTLTKIEKEEAILMLDKIIELNPNDIKFYFNKANFLDKLWKKEEAIFIYDKIIKLDSTQFSAYRAKRDNLIKLWKKEEAINVLKDLQKIIDLQKNHI